VALGGHLRAGARRGAGWLFTVARNEVDRLRPDDDRVRDVSEAEIPEHASGEPPPDLAAEEDWVSSCVQSAVAELPDRERVPLALAYLGRAQPE